MDILPGQFPFGLLQIMDVKRTNTFLHPVEYNIHQLTRPQLIIDNRGVRRFTSTNRSINHISTYFLISLQCDQLIADSIWKIN